jgi:hypothetical protein
LQSSAFGADFIFSTPPESFVCAERTIDQKKIESRGWREHTPRLFLCVLQEAGGLNLPAFSGFQGEKTDDHRNEGRRSKKREG